MRLSTTEQRYCQRKNNNNEVNFSGKTKYFSENLFMPLANFNSVHQRAALGVGALAFQPLIDYYNPMTDEKTRKFSVLKTVVKAVVGASVGIGVRLIAMKMIDKKVGITEKEYRKFVEKIKDVEVKKNMQEILKKKNGMTNFKNSLSTIVALVGLVIADFTIDMPVAKHSIAGAAKVFGMTDSVEKGGVE